MDPAANNFALLRLAAAASVVVSHSFLLATGDPLAQPLAGMTRYNLGQHAVNVFFVLSGIMVAGSLDRSATIARFALARALRILPGLAVCILVTALVFGSFVTVHPWADYVSDLRTYIYVEQTLVFGKVSAHLPGVFETNPLPLSVNEPLWTLKYEVLCYAGLALMAVGGAWRSERAFRIVLGLSLLVCVLVTITKLGPNGATITDNVARFWLCFGIGLCFYRYRARLVLSWPVLSAIGILWWFGRATSLEPALTFVLAGYGAVMLAALPVGGLRHWANRTDLSYGVYIYGWPVSQILVWAMPGIAGAMLAGFSLALAALLGFLSWTWVERPSLGARAFFVAWLDNLVSKRSVAVGSPES